jgi:hypothetical protein
MTRLETRAFLPFVSYPTRRSLPQRSITRLSIEAQCRLVHRCDSLQPLTTQESIMRHTWVIRVGIVTLFGVLVLSVGLFRLVFMADSA